MPATKPPIDHVFVILLENQTFDKVFADFPGADGDSGQKHRVEDPTWARFTRFEPTHGTPSWTFRKFWAHVFFRGKLEPQDRPLYWEWARRYVLADRLRTQRGPSTPNHVMLFAATSSGLNNNPKSSWILRFLQALFGRHPMDKEPPFDVDTVPNLLERAGISWAHYGEQDFSLYPRLADPANPGQSRNSKPNSQFAADAAAGKLAQVNWIFSDDTSYQDGVPGMKWAGRVIESIKNASGDLWNRSAIFVTFDDWGGYYDHVEPVDGEAPPGFAQGGRVPFLIISPYAKGGTVFHEPATMASVPAFIERLFRLPHLNENDRHSNDLMGAFDFNQKPLPPPVTDANAVDVSDLQAHVAPYRSVLRRILGLPARQVGPAAPPAATTTGRDGMALD